jgi:hypothetical protein
MESVEHAAKAEGIQREPEHDASENLEHILRLVCCELPNVAGLGTPSHQGPDQSHGCPPRWGAREWKDRQVSDSREGGFRQFSQPGGPCWWVGELGRSIDFHVCAGLEARMPLKQDGGWARLKDAAEREVTLSDKDTGSR